MKQRKSEKRKRIGSSVLFMVMLLTLLSVKPIKVQAGEDYTYVRSISVTGLMEPAPKTRVFDYNDLVKERMKVETDQPGAIQNVDMTWYYSTAGIEKLLTQTDPTVNALEMINSDYFGHNSPYVLKMSILLKTGYKVPTDQYSVSVNGIKDRTVKTRLNVKDRNGIYRTTVTIYKIFNTVTEHEEPDVLIQIPTQYIGDPIVSPSVSYDEYDVWTTVEVYDQNHIPVKMWANDIALKYNGISRNEYKLLLKSQLGLEYTDVFEAGFTYEYEILVVKKNMVLFSTLPKVSINGKWMNPSLEEQNTIVAVCMSGEYTVKPQKHDFSKYVSNGNGTHKVVCKDCNAVQQGHDKDTCSKKVTTSAQEGVKTYICTVCGATTTPTTAPETTPAVKVEKNHVNKDAKAEEQRVLADKSDEAPKESLFYLLQLRYKKVTNTSVTLQWTKVPKAAKYILFGAKCGEKYEKIGEFTKLTTVRNSLKKGSYYKFYLIAVNSSGKVIAGSKTVHVTTKGGKVGNYKSVKLKNVKKNKLTLKPGKQFKIKTSAVAESKKLKVKKHRGLAYESSDPKVATVSTKGVISAKAAGKVDIYVYSQSGTFAKIALTVK